MQFFKDKINNPFGVFAVSGVVYQITDAVSLFPEMIPAFGDIPDKLLEILQSIDLFAAGKISFDTRSKSLLFFVNFIIVLLNC